MAMHEIGALLFQLGLRMHHGDIVSIDQWNENPRGVAWVDIPPRVTLFSHHGYLAHDVYPDGVADIVGYWAEDHILGGVTVFDRQAEQRASRYPPNVYFHSCRAGVTNRYYQLRDEQQQALLEFLLADTQSDNSPTSLLPIVADKSNTVRVDEEKAIFSHFYRDIWERKPPTQEYLKFLERAPKSVGDYPEYEAFFTHLNTNFGTTTIVCPCGRGECCTASNAAHGDTDGGTAEEKEKWSHDQDSKDAS